MGQVEESRVSSSGTQKGAWKIMSNILELAKCQAWSRQITDLAGWQTGTGKEIEGSGVQRRCCVRLLPDHFSQLN